jgi:hypothetical protein
MKVGIVGWGMISGHHLTAARRYPGSKVVDLADRDITRARPQPERFSVKRAFENLADLPALKPDVVHVCHGCRTFPTTLWASWPKSPPQPSRKSPRRIVIRIKTRLARIRWDRTKARPMLQGRPPVSLRDDLTNVFRAYASTRTTGRVSQ